MKAVRNCCRAASDNEVEFGKSVLNADPKAPKTLCVRIRSTVLSKDL